MAGSGGVRPGAGRKRKADVLKLKDLSAEILAANNPEKIWAELLQSKSDKVRLDAIIYLTDRIHGKAVQHNTIANPDGSTITGLSVVYISSKISDTT